MLLNTEDNFIVDYQVTEKVYHGFIDIFKDRNSLHTDTEYAQSKGFRDKVMQGAILSGFLSHFIGECLPDKNVIILSNKISFHKPVYLDDQLQLRATVSETSPALQCATITYQFNNTTGVTVSKGEVSIKII